MTKFDKQASSLVSRKEFLALASVNIATQYEQSGYVYQPAFLDQHELEQLRRITAHFHQHWLQENQNFYRQWAINSAYLTHIERMSDDDRHAMFAIIGSAKMALVVAEVRATAIIQTTKKLLVSTRPKNSYKKLV